MQIIDVSDEVWTWVHQKYIMNEIVQNFYAFKINDWFYLAITDSNILNYPKNGNYNLECTKIKTMTTKKASIVWSWT